MRPHRRRFLPRRRFPWRRQNILALLMIGLVLFAALAAPALSPPGSSADPPGFKRVGPAADRVPRPPRPGAPLGTTGGQWDVLHTLVWGIRSALIFGLTVAFASAAIGVLFGAAAGYAGGYLNALAMRVTDAFLAFPVLAGLWLFAFLLTPADADPTGLEALVPGLKAPPPTALQTLLAGLNMPPLMLALICFSWMPYMRLVNANVRRLKDSEAVVAARAVGVPAGRLLLRHLLPGAISPAIVLLARDIGLVVVMQANFAFIGVDASSPWGAMLAANRNWIMGPGGSPVAYWWAFLPVTFALIFFAIAWNLAGDSLDDALNPRRAR